jgi:hypothetical protein
VCPSTVKRLAARASLQQTVSNHILSPGDLFLWAKQNIGGIDFFFVSKDEVEAASKKLTPRFDNAPKIHGVRSQHCFLPWQDGSLRMFRLSADATSTDACTDRCDETPNLQPGQYVAAVYDHKWYIGCVVTVDEAMGDVKFNFMCRIRKTCNFKWPTHQDECFVPLNHILTRSSLHNFWQTILFPTYCY